MLCSAAAREFGIAEWRFVCPSRLLCCVSVRKYGVIQFVPSGIFGLCAIPCRFHQRHLDLMEQLAMFNGRANAPLDQIATLLGFPGKMGMSGAKVFDTFQAGDLKAIRDYCETDVLNTWLVFLRFQMLRGELDATGYQAELDLLRDYLKAEGHPHFLSFLEAWEAAGN